MTSDNTTYRLADDIRHRRVLDEGVVVKQDSNEVLVINEVSATILDFFAGQGNLSARDLIDLMQAEYEVEPTVLQIDIEKHLAELARAGVITEKESGS